MGAQISIKLGFSTTHLAFSDEISDKNTIFRQLFDSPKYTGAQGQLIPPAFLLDAAVMSPTLHVYLKTAPDL